MSIIILIYLICFAATLGAAFAFMWRSMDLVFKEIDKPTRKIHPELEDVIQNNQPPSKRVEPSQPSAEPQKFDSQSQNDNINDSM